MRGLLCTSIGLSLWGTLPAQARSILSETFGPDTNIFLTTGSVFVTPDGNTWTYVGPQSSSLPVTNASIIDFAGNISSEEPFNSRGWISAVENASIYVNVGAIDPSFSLYTASYTAASLNDTNNVEWIGTFHVGDPISTAVSSLPGIDNGGESPLSTLQTLSYAPTAADAGSNLYFRITRVGDSNFLFFDNLEVSAVPSPSTMAVGGVALLTLFTRRRRKQPTV